MVRAVSRNDSEHLLLGGVAFLALPEPPGPLAQQRRRAGQLTVGGDDIVRLGSIQEVVIDRLAGLRDPAQHILLAFDAGLDIRDGGIVPQHAVTATRNEHRDADLHVLLLQVDRGPAITHVTVLVLAQAVNLFIRRERKAVAGAGFAGTLLFEDRPARQVAERNEARTLVNVRAQRARGEVHGGPRFLNLEENRGRRGNNTQTVNGRNLRALGVRNPHDAVGPDFEAQRAGIQAHQYAVRLFLHGGNRSRPSPATERSRSESEKPPK